MGKLHVLLLVFASLAKSRFAEKYCVWEGALSWCKIHLYPAKDFGLFDKWAAIDVQKLEGGMLDWIFVSEEKISCIKNQSAWFWSLALILKLTSVRDILDFTIGEWGVLISVSYSKTQFSSQVITFSKSSSSSHNLAERSEQIYFLLIFFTKKTLYQLNIYCNHKTIRNPMTVWYKIF